MKKYALCPGFVTSDTDGQRHYIGAGRLADLYGVPMAECVVFDPNMPHLMRGVKATGLIFLRPRHHREDYKVPNAL